MHCNYLNHIEIFVQLRDFPNVKVTALLLLRRFSKCLRRKKAPVGHAKGNAWMFLSY